MHEPVLNPLQVLVLMLIVVFEVVSNVLPLVLGMDINPVYVVVTMVIGIVSFAAISLLRAAYPEAVPDNRIVTSFSIFIKQIMDALVKSKADEETDLKSLLERLMTWAVREWDVIYQKELEEALNYAKTMFKENDMELPIDLINTEEDSDIVNGYVYTNGISTGTGTDSIADRKAELQAELEALG